MFVEGTRLIRWKPYSAEVSYCVATGVAHHQKTFETIKTVELLGNSVEFQTFVKE